MHIEDVTASTAVWAFGDSSGTGRRAYCQHVWCKGHCLGDYEVLCYSVLCIMWLSPSSWSALISACSSKMAGNMIIALMI